jgi:hypothetical protein
MHESACLIWVRNIYTSKNGQLYQVITSMRCSGIQEKNTVPQAHRMNISDLLKGDVAGHLKIN